MNLHILKMLKILSTLLKRHCLLDSNDDRLIVAKEYPKDNNLSLNILFQMAYEYAEVGVTPLFICNKSEIEKLPPVLVNIYESDYDDIESTSKRWSPSVLNKIQMKYVSSSYDVKMLMASIHDFKPKVDVLIFHNLNEIIDPNKSLSVHDDVTFNKVAQTLRFIDDAVTYLSRNHAYPEINALNTDVHLSSYERTDMLALRLIIGNDTVNLTFKHLLRQISQKSYIVIKSSGISNQIEDSLEVCLYIPKKRPADDDDTVLTIFDGIKKSSDSKVISLHYCH